MYSAPCASSLNSLLKSSQADGPATSHPACAAGTMARKLAPGAPTADLYRCLDVTVAPARRNPAPSAAPSLSTFRVPLNPARPAGAARSKPGPPTAACRGAVSLWHEPLAGPRCAVHWRSVGLRRGHCRSTMQDPLSLSVVLLPSVPPVRPLVLILTSLPRTFPSPLSETIPISVPSFQALAPSPALCFGLVSEVSCTAFREQLQEHRRALHRLDRPAQSALHRQLGEIRRLLGRCGPAAATHLALARAAVPARPPIHPLACGFFGDGAAAWRAAKDRASNMRGAPTLLALLTRGLATRSSFLPVSLKFTIVFERVPLTRMACLPLSSSLLMALARSCERAQVR